MVAGSLAIEVSRFFLVARRRLVRVAARRCGVIGGAGLTQVDIDRAEAVVVAEDAREAGERLALLRLVGQRVERFAAVVAREFERVGVAVAAERLLGLRGDVAVVGEEVGGADVARGAALQAQRHAVGILRSRDGQRAVAEAFDALLLLLPCGVGLGRACGERELGADVGGLVAARLAAELSRAADGEARLGRGSGLRRDFPDGDGLALVGVAGVEPLDAVGRLPEGPLDLESGGCVERQLHGQTDGAGVAEVGVPRLLNLHLGGDEEGLAALVGLHACESREAQLVVGLRGSAGHSAEIKSLHEVAVGAGRRNLC